MPDFDYDAPLASSPDGQEFSVYHGSLHGISYWRIQYQPAWCCVPMWVRKDMSEEQANAMCQVANEHLRVAVPLRRVYPDSGVISWEEFYRWLNLR